MAKYYLFEVTEDLKTKVSGTDFIDYYPNISSEMSFRNLKPYIRQAWNNYIAPFLGEALISSMNTSDGSNPTMKEAVELVKQSLALYTVYLAYPQNNQFISDGNINQSITDSTQPISQWAFNTARWAQLIAAEKSLDVALNYIISKNISGYDGSKYTHTWIESTDILLNYIRVNGIRAFLNIRPYFDAAGSELALVIGCDTYEDLLENITEAEYSKAVDKVRAFISHKALQLSIPRMLTFVEGTSIIVLSSADGVKDGFGLYTSANLEAIKILIQSCSDDASRALNDLRNIMNKDLELFTVWADHLDSLKNKTDLLVSRDCHGHVTGGVMLP